jgi:hypothetical protein
MAFKTTATDNDKGVCTDETRWNTGSKAPNQTAILISTAQMRSQRARPQPINLSTQAIVPCAIALTLTN